MTLAVLQTFKVK